jgi:site-specific recombinase XerD
VTATSTRGSLTVAEAAMMLRELVKDRGYVDETGLGREVDSFLTYFRTERGKTEGTITSYEYTLARLAIYYADLTFADFEGRTGTTLIRDFLREKYGDCAGSTWNTKVATVKAFFKWAHEEWRMESNPSAIIRYRQVAGHTRSAHPSTRIQALVAAQDERRDRVAIQLLGRLALRRNELRVVQFRHLNTDTHELTVYGKGGTVLNVPVFDDLYEQMLRERLERQAHPDEYLLYPVKLGRLGTGRDARMGVIWDDRMRPLSSSGIDKWWVRCVDRAGLERFPMHELRHSAGTEFWRQTRDLRMTQRLMRHKTIRTTADVYLHDDTADLADAMTELPAWEVEDK